MTQTTRRWLSNDASLWLWVTAFLSCFRSWASLSCFQLHRGALSGFWWRPACSSACNGPACIARSGSLAQASHWHQPLQPCTQDDENWPRVDLSVGRLAIVRALLITLCTDSTVFSFRVRLRHRAHKPVCLLKLAGYCLSLQALGGARDAGLACRVPVWHHRAPGNTLHHAPCTMHRLATHGVLHHARCAMHRWHMTPCTRHRASCTTHPQALA